MRKQAALLFLATGFAVAAHAQANPLADGRWLAEWKLPNGTPRSAELEMQGGAGTYTNLGLPATADQCLRRPAPAQAEAREGQPHLVVLRSKALAGCEDTVLKLVVGADGSVSSSFPDGRPLQFRKR